MKKILLGMAVASLSLSAPGMAELPHQWKCSWTGSWGVKGEPGKEDFKMDGFMFAADGGWVIRANAVERAGKSHVRAGCGAGDCWFEQKFPEPAGSTYFSMKSKDTPQANGMLSIKYDGSWGDEEDAATHKGSIQFTGSCKPLKLKQEDDIDPLMKKELGWDDETY